jgi:hypothetical protein
VFDPATATFQSDRVAEPLLSDAALRAVASADDQQITYTCVPPGEGVRLGIDRDADGIYDRDQIDATTGTPTARPTPTASPALPATATSIVTASPTSTPTPTANLTRSASPPPPPTSTASPLRGDADCNGRLGADDLASECTAAFNMPSAPQCGADCNADGVVDAADLTCLARLLGGSLR